MGFSLWTGAEEGDPLPPIVMWFQTKEEQGIKIRLHNPWRSRQKNTETQKVEGNKTHVEQGTHEEHC